MSGLQNSLFKKILLQVFPPPSPWLNPPLVPSLQAWTQNREGYMLLTLEERKMNRKKQVGKELVGPSDKKRVKIDLWKQINECLKKKEEAIKGISLKEEERKRVQREEEYRKRNKEISDEVNQMFKEHSDAMKEPLLVAKFDEGKKPLVVEEEDEVAHLKAVTEAQSRDIQRLAWEN